MRTFIKIYANVTTGMGVTQTIRGMFTFSILLAVFLKSYSIKLSLLQLTLSAFAIMVVCYLVGDLWNIIFQKELTEFFNRLNPTLQKIKKEVIKK
jgi:DNA integrity scanning protein DisA with diadenylate cyclase activity